MPSLKVKSSQHQVAEEDRKNVMACIIK